MRGPYILYFGGAEAGWLISNINIKDKHTETYPRFFPGSYFSFSTIRAVRGESSRHYAPSPPRCHRRRCLQLRHRGCPRLLRDCWQDRHRVRWAVAALQVRRREGVIARASGSMYVSRSVGGAQALRCSAFATARRRPRGAARGQARRAPSLLPL